MLKIFSLKLYRKFLILAVLLGCLSFISSVNRSHAEPCCSELHCMDNYVGCVALCDYAWQNNPLRHAQCVGYCLDDLNACQSTFCDSKC